MKRRKFKLTISVTTSSEKQIENFMGIKGDILSGKIQNQLKCDDSDIVKMTFEEIGKKDIQEFDEKKEILKRYFDWHKSMGFVSHKPEDIDEFMNLTTEKK